MSAHNLVLVTNHLNYREILMNYLNILKSRAFQTTSFCLILLMAGTSLAQSEYPKTAEETIRSVFGDLFSNLEELMDTHDQAESEYYRRIDSVMSPWIDYEAIARGVMGRKYYTMATEEQRQKFQETFKHSLVETYGKSLLGVQNPDFELETPGSGNTDSNVQIRQTLFSGTGRVVVIYSMGQVDDGRWQVRNVILEGINLGRTFRNQFARSAQEYNEDLDKVINNWSPEA